MNKRLVVEEISALAQEASPSSKTQADIMNQLPSLAISRNEAMKE